jgi:hypothetical protein
MRCRKTPKWYIYFNAERKKQQKKNSQNNNRGFKSFIVVLNTKNAES